MRKALAEREKPTRFNVGLSQGGGGIMFTICTICTICTIFRGAEGSLDKFGGGCGNGGKEAQNEPETNSVNTEDSEDNVNSVDSALDSVKIRSVEEIRIAYLGLQCPVCKKQKVVITHRICWFDLKREPWLICNDCAVSLIKKLTF